MLLRTHLAFAVLMTILLLPYVSDKLIFVVLVLISTGIPDIDSGFSKYGKSIFLRPLQFFIKHRSFIHSFTFAILISFILSFFYPVVCFGFFVGFSSHLILDSFTKDGIRPFWPLNYKSSGFIASGGKIEMSFFIALIAADIFIICFYLFF
jgi:inner membrane protein